MPETYRERTVHVREPDGQGGFRTKYTKRQFQMAPISISLLGVVTIEAWGPWKDQEEVVVLQDENGNPSQ